MNFPKRPSAFVLLSTNHGSMIVNKNDYATSSACTYGVGHDLFTASSFSQDEIDDVLQLVQLRRGSRGDGVVILDCGANIGVHTVHWSKMLHGWGNVIAFEAQERLYYALAGNIALNNCFNAQAIWAAVGAQTGTIRIPVPDYFIPSNFGGFELNQSDSNENIGQAIDYDPAKGQNIRLIAIDDLGLERVDFIKIDVEGMEMDVLKGAEATIRTHQPIMMIEVLKTGESLAADFLTAMGYKLLRVGYNLLAIHGGEPFADQITVR